MRKSEISQWKKKIYLLAQTTPSIFVVKILEKKELENLVTKGFISFRSDIFFEKYYFFYCEKYIYGIFKPTEVKYNCILLKNLTQYTNPLRLWDIHKNKDKLKATFLQKTKLIRLLEKENEKEIYFILKIEKKEHAIDILASSKTFDELIYYFSISDEKKIQHLEYLFQEIHEILDENDNLQKEEKDFEHLVSLGSELSNFIFYQKKWQGLYKKVPSFITMKFYNKSYIPISVLNYPLKIDEQQQQIFPFIKLKTNHHCKEKIHHDERSDSAQSDIINSFAVVDLIEDVHSKLELEAIKKRQNLCIRKDLQSSYASGNLYNFESLFAHNDFVHIIAHGEQREKVLYFCNQTKEIFSGQDFKFFSKMPKVLFLSVCFSENEEIVKHFFHAGGQTLIVSAGKLSVQHLHYYLSTFYWQLFSARHTINTAFHSMTHKLFKHKKINTFRLKIYGDGKEFFVDKRSFGENPLMMSHKT